MRASAAVLFKHRAAGLLTCAPAAGTAAAAADSADVLHMAGDGGLAPPPAELAAQDLDSLRPGQPLSSRVVEFFLR